METSNQQHKGWLAIFWEWIMSFFRKDTETEAIEDEDPDTLAWKEYIESGASSAEMSERILEYLDAICFALMEQGYEVPDPHEMYFNTDTIFNDNFNNPRSH